MLNRIYLKKYYYNKQERSRHTQTPPRVLQVKLTWNLEPQVNSDSQSIQKVTLHKDSSWCSRRGRGWEAEPSHTNHLGPKFSSPSVTKLVPDTSGGPAARGWNSVQL